MANTNASSLFVRLTAAWRLLSLRSDVDDIILELLGRFSLERVYADSDKQTYGQLVITLLIQLNTIFYVQRLSLPPENQPAAWYLGCLVSWEVALRTLEFVVQAVIERRESLWKVLSIRDEYLPKLLLSALRTLSLHPRMRGKNVDRRDRFARIHRSLEEVCDNYPDSRSFLLLVCKEVTNALCSNPNALALPPRLKDELPTAATGLVWEPQDDVEAETNENGCSILFQTACLPSMSPASSRSILYQVTGCPSSWRSTTCPSSSSEHRFNMP
jgi:hypothetical protein